MTPPSQAREHKPFVPPNVQMKEFTLRAVLLGLVMCVMLGAANAYLGLRAGQTIAATYPAAVIGMAVLRIFKGSILEENIARTAGSIGESVAAGAVFTIPAFVISRFMAGFLARHRVLEVHGADDDRQRAGRALRFAGAARAGGRSRSCRFRNPWRPRRFIRPDRWARRRRSISSTTWGWARAVFLAGAFGCFATDKDWFFPSVSWEQRLAAAGRAGHEEALATGGVTVFSGPTVSPAYIGVGYVIGPALASLNFSGSMIAWGLLIPLLMYFLGPQLQTFLPANATDESWLGASRTRCGAISCGPIAVGGMLTGATYTLFKMRKSLGVGLARAFQEMKPAPRQPETTARTERYMSSRVVLLGIFGGVRA